MSVSKTAPIQAFASQIWDVYITRELRKAGRKSIDVMFMPEEEWTALVEAGREQMKADLPQLLDYYPNKGS